MYTLVRINYLLLAIKAIVDADVHGTLHCGRDAEINMIRTHVYEALGLDVPNTSEERREEQTWH